MRLWLSGFIDIDGCINIQYMVAIQIFPVTQEGFTSVKFYIAATIYSANALMT